MKTQRTRFFELNMPLDVGVCRASFVNLSRWKFATLHLVACRIFAPSEVG